MNLFLKYLSILIFLLFSTIGFSQENSVSGFVKDNQGEPLPGVTVFAVGTKTGATTNIEGKYVIKTDSDSLEFRFVGMATQRVKIAGRTIIDITLIPEVYQFDEVVVTALGITKESKSLGYSVTAVNSDELTKAGDKNILNSLQGKVAGVNITSASGAPGASTRILLRGVSSLSGSNQPLFVIDGVPVSNSQSGSSSINGGTDFGNKINDINMDDVESATFLKGASGTALYGSRAANGVIIITTKKGKEKTKAQVSYSGGVGFEKPLRLVKYQNMFGEGIYGNHVLYENMSWGPAFDNRFHPWGNVVGDSVRVKSYRALEDNVKDFFTTGFNTNHSISVSGGNEITTYYLSYSNMFWDGIFPTDADSYTKHTFAIRGSQKIGKNFTASASLNYLRKKNSSVPTGQSNASVYNQIMQTPRDISILEQKDLNNPWNTVDNYYSLYTVNPWFILYNNGNENKEDRIYGNLELNANLPFQINAVWRLGGDVSNENQSQWRLPIRPLGNNEQSSVFDPGMKSRSYVNSYQINSDFILSWHKTFGKFDLSFMAGQSANERKSDAFATGVSYLALQNFPNLSNSLESPSSGESMVMVRSTGIYSGADFSYKSMVFLSVTIRNDWSSTLPAKNNSFHYPGVNTSVIITELIPSLKKVLTYGKIRASWAQVGNDAAPYSVDPVYQQAAHTDGYGYFAFPTKTGVNAYEKGSFIGNPELRPEITTEYELGGDLKFFNNRLSLDIAYYNKSTRDLIWASPIAYTSGYSYQMQNLGQLTNHGIEALIGLTPVKTRNFSWAISLNYTKNYNLLKSLNTQLEQAELNALRIDGGQQISWLAIPGQPVGVFKARGPKYTSDGKLIVDNQGLPVADDELKVYGNSQYKYYGGVINTFTIKGFTLSANVDYRIGGMMYSRTKNITLWAGTVPETLYNDRQPFVIPNSVYEVGREANGDPKYTENTTPLDRTKIVEYWGNGGTELDGASFIDKSFIKLREVTVGYNLPSAWTKFLHLQRIFLGVSGKNLLLWTPKGQTYIDPELTTFGNDLLADFGEYGAQPSVRSLSINLKVDF
jgi:TonB-linked SusC/RagA family outer membrane protein